VADAIPSARRLGFLASPTLESARAELLAGTAARLGVELTTRTARGGAIEYVDAFAALKTAGAAGVLIQQYPTFVRDEVIIAPIAVGQGLPTICAWNHMARLGCAFGFGPDL